MTESGSDSDRLSAVSILASGTTPNGLRVVLRTPRLSDADAWRRVRLDDRAAIEPYWAYSGQSWPDQHRRRVWVREWIAGRRRMRRGQSIHTIGEVDGQLAGQCDAWLERYHQRGELGMWIHSRWSGDGVGLVAVGLLIDYLFNEVGLERVSAPIACGNVPPTRLAEHLSFVHEGVMRSYMTSGKGRCDYDLWSMTRKDWLARSKG